ncbi:hypothetical protein ACRS8V_07420 [Staphylococcus epidermidis]
MKKFLALIFSGALILGACGNDDISNNNSDTKSESKTEKKADDKKDNKSKEEKKSQENEDDKSTQEDNSTEEQNTQETATSEQVQSQQPVTQEKQQTQQANQQNYNDQQSYNEPTKDEIYEWDKQNIPGGTDYGLIDPEDVNEPSDSQNEEPDEWIKGQEEWANATQSEKEEIRKRDAEKYGYEYDPSDYEE